MERAKPPADITVGILLASPSGGGALSAITRLIPLLEAAGVRVTLLTDQDQRRFQLRSGDQAKIVVLPRSRSGSLERFLVAILALPRVLLTIVTIRREAKRQPELVFLPFLTGTALVTLAATLGLRNPVIVCERNDPSRQRHGWHVELLKRLLYPEATAITVNAPRQDARDHLVRVSRNRPVHFVPNPRPKGITPADVRSSRVILSVGRLVPQKRHETLIEAFAQVHEHIPEWSLRIAGDGRLHERLTELLEQHDLSDKVELAREAIDPAQLYSEAAVFVLASDYEGTSNALLEAASAGLPCIVSEETAPPHTDGILMHVPAGSADALAATLLAVCTDVDSREEMGRAAHLWERQVTDHDVVADWMSVIDSVIATPRSTS